MDLSPLMTDACIWAQVTNWNLPLQCPGKDKRHPEHPAASVDRVCLLEEGGEGLIHATCLPTEGREGCETPGPYFLQVCINTQ